MRFPNIKSESPGGCRGGSFLNSIWSLQISFHLLENLPRDSDRPWFRVVFIIDRTDFGTATYSIRGAITFCGLDQIVVVEKDNHIFKLDADVGFLPVVNDVATFAHIPCLHSAIRHCTTHISATQYWYGRPTNHSLIRSQSESPGACRPGFVFFDRSDGVEGAPVYPRQFCDFFSQRPGVFRDDEEDFTLIRRHIASPTNGFFLDNLAQSGAKLHLIFRRNPNLVCHFFLLSPASPNCATVTSIGAFAANSSSIFSIIACFFEPANPVPAGMRRPMMTFSLRPMSRSIAPPTAASASLRGVFWKEIAERKDARVRETSVIPSRSCFALSGSPSCSFITRVKRSYSKSAMISPAETPVSPEVTTETRLNICFTIISRCLRPVETPCNS